MRVAEVLQLFLADRRARGCAASTVGWYEGRLTRFVVACGDRECENLASRDVVTFVGSLRLQGERYCSHPFREVEPGGLSAWTIRGYGRALRQFTRWMSVEGLTDGDLMVDVRLPKAGGRVVRGISWGDFLRVLRACDGSGMPERDRALVLFLADTGCRVGGLVDLRLSDVVLGRRRALVLEKGNKPRWVFYTEVTKEALTAWLEVRAQVAVFGDRVFVNVRGEPLTVSGVNQLLRRLAAAGGCEGRCNPHSFRHAFARAYLEKGGDLSTLADLLGHESVETTRSFYAVFQVDELARKHDRFSPVSGLGEVVRDRF